MNQSSEKPPHWIERLLKRFLPARLLDAVLGDLHEKFQKRLAHGTPKWKASLLYSLEGIGFLRLVRFEEKSNTLIPLDMYKNYFLIALRYFRQEKFYSFLNLGGLCLGLTSVIILFVFVFNELSYDKFHKDYDRIYRLTTVFKVQEKETRYALNEGLWDAILADEVPGVEHSTAFMTVQNELVFSTADKSFIERNGFFSDPEFFQVFDFHFISGSPTNALLDPHAIVLTRSLAEKIFGSVDVIDKIIIWKEVGTTTALKVSAVVEDPPANSTVKFNFIIAGAANSYWADQFSTTNRSGNTLHIYFKTQKPQDLQLLQNNIDRSFAKKITTTANFGYKTPVQELKDVYLHANNEFELTAGGNINFIKIFFIVGLGIIVITIVNSVNLHTARSVRRAKEVGIRKSMGTGRPVIVMQFLFESMTITLFAGSLSGFIAFFTLANFVAPYFSIETSLITNPVSVLIIILISLLLGFAIGIYPALKLASYKVVAALKGKITETRESYFGLRSVLVLLQIVTTTSLLAFSILISRQINFLSNKPLGYDKENLIYFTQPNDVSAQQWKAFQEKLKTYPAFSAVGGCSYPLIGAHSMSRAQFESNKSDQLVTAAWNSVDNDFIETMKMSIVEGKNFSPILSNEHSILINEAFRDALGLPVVIGTKLKWWRGEFEIIGVVKDFHFKPFNAKITPAVFIVANEPVKHTFARTSTIRGTSALSQAKEAWSEVGITVPFEVGFFDEAFSKMLEKEYQSGKIITVFTFISLLITGIGLIGLIGYTASQYRKEIGIRKVLGASIPSILNLIGARFIILLGIGLIVSIPVIFPLTEYWLSGFAYKVSLTTLDIVIAGACIIFFTLVVVSRQALLSAAENPIATIKEE